MNILVLESSTSSSKILQYCTTSQKSKIRSVEHPDLISTDKTAETVISSLFNLSKESKFKNVDAIIISSTWHNLLVCDNEFRPITPAFYWNSNIAMEAVDEFKTSDKVKSFYEKTGCIVHPQYPYFKLKQLEAEGLDLSDKKITDIGSYIFYLLTNDFSVSKSMYSGSGLLNINTQLFDEDILKDLNLNDNNLGKLQNDNYHYKLSEKGKVLLGINQDVDVYLAYPDGALNQIGEQNKSDNSMSFSIGTSAALRIHQKQPIISKKMTTWCYLTPYNYLVGGATAGASNTLEWIKRMLFPNTDYDEIMKEYEPNKLYPVFLPFLYNERSPGWDYNKTGSFVHLANSTSKHDLYFAVVEGIVFNAFQTYESLIETVAKPDSIKLSGGFTNSPTTAKLCCDIFNEEIILSKETQQSLMGGVKLVSELTNSNFTLDEDNQLLIPDKKLTKIYQDKYRRYLKAYRGES